MARAWNKGHTRETHPSVRKMADTMRRKKIDNFAKWREEARRNGTIPDAGRALKKSGDLAELIGVVLGDGNIYKFARTEGLRIVGNTKYPGFFVRYEQLIENVFEKRPTTTKRKGSNAADIRLYQRNISRRIGIPTGAKGDLKFIVPEWIAKDREFVCRFLRGLYESDGCYAVHEKTYTYKFIFSNRNNSLLTTVFTLLEHLGFHPHRSKYAVQVSRRAEVEKLRKLVHFREY